MQCHYHGTAKLQDGATYRGKLDRWPRHVTPSEKRQLFDVITLFATYILGQEVDPIRNVTSSRCHVLGHKVDPIRNVTTSHFGFWAIGMKSPHEIIRITVGHDRLPRRFATDMQWSWAIDCSTTPKHVHTCTSATAVVMSN